ncbi:MAG: DNA polymerase III subunit gamma/tau [Bacteroidales bacterium]|nr:DNA polymerase III subunit gamma/tau [Bacteroidales bacterium]MDD4669888.1 DNA polymerase III subunit gamma/tau [Bacteroidales bacterium]
MGQFIVSARKYRPNTFDALIGQENIAKTLKNSILRDKLAHAYLFCGPRGVGKTSAARIFAKTINCSHLSEQMEPCGTCESCLSFAEGRSFSIHELDAASNNSVEDIRALTDKVRIPPQIGKYSVYIIDEVHMLSQQAFNAFLKTLEEPPAHAIFILATTEKHKILPTILSRCQTYDFNRITVENIVKNIKDIAQKEDVTISDDAMHIIAQKADGAMRDALTLFDQTVAFCGKEITYEQVIRNLNVLDYEYYFKLTDDFLSGDYASALLTFDEILSKGFNALHFIAGLSTHFRDLLVCKNDASRTLVELAPTIAQQYRNISERCTVDFLFEALSYTTSCEAAYKQSGNQRLSIEFTLMKLCRIIRPVSVENNKVAAVPAGAPSVAPAHTAPAADTSNKNKKSAGLSIKDVLKQVTEKEEVVQKQEQTAEYVLNPDNFQIVWKLLAENESSSPRLASAISQSEPEFDPEHKTITFLVANVSQKDWIEKKCRERLESFIQDKFGDRELRLFVEVKKDEETSVKNDIYMPTQKAEFLLNNSEDLRNLKKDLDLEIS